MTPRVSRVSPAWGPPKGVRRYTHSVSLVEALSQKVLLGDGANGTCLVERGFHQFPYDLANIIAPELVSAVHKEYFDAGADFVETNTFSANRFRLEGTPYDISEINRLGAEIARKVAPEGRYVMGAIGPCGKPIEPIGSICSQDAFDAFAEQAKALLEGGVDGFMLETFVDVEELRIAVSAVRSLTDLPIFATKAYIEDGEMLAEGLPTRCSTEIAAMGVTAVGANCIVGPQRMLDLVRMMAEGTDVPLIAFPTPGLPQLVKGQICYDTSPSYFAKASVRLIEEGARIIGGCCGTTPAHIRELRKAIDAGIKTKPRAAVTRESKTKVELMVTEPSDLAKKIGAEFIVAVEMDVPRGLNIDKLLAGASLLKSHGADVINISDGARARLRMNPAAVSTLIQNQVGIEVCMHFACRDRNLLAIQSDLLGWHALGIRNILAVTGDPANIGDYPSATSVFDIDSIGLCRIMNRFNSGFDLAGYSIGVKTGFTICSAYNPAALDQELENDRLRRKLESGAKLVYTQPVFDEKTADLAIEFCSKLGVALCVGILPLKSSRHAEFMHNEVPGMNIPDDLRNRVMSAASDSDALEIGIEEAQKLSQYIHAKAQGLYLMPPFGNAEMAARVISAIR